MNVLIVLVVVLGICLIFVPEVLAQDNASPELSGCTHAFYYPWYGNPEDNSSWIHWNQPSIPQKKEPSIKRNPPADIGASFYPEMGLYSSTNEKDIAVHMEHLRRARVGVVALTWWGQGSYMDKAVPRILDCAQKAGIEVCFHLEPYRGRTAQSTKDDVKYIVKSYGDHPAFYRNKEHGNKPLFYIYDPYHISASDWASILSATGDNTIRNTDYDALMISLFVDSTFYDYVKKGCFDGFYTYFAVDGFVYGSTVKNWLSMMKFARDNNLLFIPSVGPGYEDLRVRPWNTVNVRDREDGKYYDRMFQAALAIDPEIVSITSYDEWHEGTQIAPAVPKKVDDQYYLDYGDKDPHFYLDKTAEWVEKFESGTGCHEDREPFIGAYVHIRDCYDMEDPVEKREADIAKSMAEFKAHGLQVVMPYATNTSGTSNYPSKVVPVSNYGDWDVIAVFAREARKNGLKFYPAICGLHSGASAPRGILVKHPEWALNLSGEKTGSISPAPAEARKWVVSLVDELIERYAPDGILLDYLRFPNSTHITLDDAANEQYLKECEKQGLETAEEKKALLQKMKTESLTQLAKEISDSARALKPDIQLAMYTWGPHVISGHNLCQDWKTWAAEGYVDMVNVSGYCFPKNYGDEYMNVFKKRLEETRNVMTETNSDCDLTFCLGVRTSHGEVTSAEDVHKYFIAAKELGYYGMAFFTWPYMTKYLDASTTRKYLEEFEQ